jgi:predicted GIY-YIG superfamily endonuclease
MKTKVEVKPGLLGDGEPRAFYTIHNPQKLDTIHTIAQNIREGHTHKMKHHVYLLQALGSEKAYVGYTSNLGRRIRQHNREIKGGAKKTRDRQWRKVCHVSGFTSKCEALQFEWMWQHPHRSRKLKHLREIRLKGRRGTIPRKLNELVLALPLFPHLFVVK